MPSAPVNSPPAGMSTPAAMNGEDGSPMFGGRAGRTHRCRASIRRSSLPSEGNYSAAPTKTGEPSSTEETPAPARSGEEGLNPLTMR